jgi:hypothetical protein
MSYSCSDFTDSILDALNIEVPEDDKDNPSAQADLALAEIQRLHTIEKMHKAAPATSMDRMLYLVAPTNDQCNHDDDGVVSMDLFVWDKNASEAVKLWREHYELTDEESPLGVKQLVRVFECPIMPNGAKSATIQWDQIHTYAATVKSRSEI